MVERFKIDRTIFHTKSGIRFIIDSTGTHDEVNLIVQGVKDGEKIDYVRTPLLVDDVLAFQSFISTAIEDIRRRRAEAADG
jgi:hypothetical protein